jgi:hypothetical protein
MSLAVESISSLSPDEQKVFIQNAINQMSDQEYQRFERSLDGVPSNIRELKDADYDYVKTYDDIDDGVEELLIEGSKGEIIWHIKGKDNVKDFLEDHRKTTTRVKYEQRLKSMQLSRKEKSVVKRHLDKLAKDGLISKGELSDVVADMKDSEKPVVSEGSEGSEETKV